LTLETFFRLAGFAIEEEDDDLVAYCDTKLNIMITIKYCQSYRRRMYLLRTPYPRSLEIYGEPSCLE
jgi:hypothetical protein